MGIMKEISVKALAKINLGLDVVRRREDGYHEVKMVMQTIHLFDRLEMKKTASGITMTTNLSFLPTNENNLVYKAAKPHSGRSGDGWRKYRCGSSALRYESDV